jgi:hypothetical protein
MNSRRLGFPIVAMLSLPWQSAADAAPLKVVKVGAPAVNCVFQANCTITVSDSTGAIAMPFLQAPGTVWMQSRTFVGAAGTPAAGLTGYMYRLSMTQAAGFGDCIAGFTINFGPVSQLPYQQGTPAHIFVVTSGGLGTIGLKSAEQDGDVITFEFEKPLCVPPTPSVAATTFFFGLASVHGPKATAASAFAFGNPPFYQFDVRVPNH